MDVIVGFPLNPGQCFGCGEFTPSLKVLDFGKDDPNKVQLHRVYVCEKCIVSAAQSMLKGSELAIVRTVVLEDLRREVRALTAEVAGGREAQRILRELAQFAPEPVTA